MTGVIEIVTDGGKQYGLGHLRRTATLASTLKHRSLSVRVVCLSEESSAFLPNCPQDQGPTNLVVVDLPYARDDIVKAAREAGKKVAGLDYPGQAMLDLAVTLDESHTGTMAEREIKGLQYALVRDEISRLAPATDGSGVLVLMGGADIRNLGTSVARRLAVAGHKVTLVRGPISTQTADIELPDNIDVLVNPADLAQRMAGCGWAVTNGGTTMLELLSLGKAVHVIPQTHAEHHFAEPLNKKGALLGVGDDIPLEVDAERRHRIGECARAIVDGKGADRVACAIEMLNTSRELM